MKITLEFDDLNDVQTFQSMVWDVVEDRNWRGHKNLEALYSSVYRQIEEQLLALLEKRD